MALKTTVLLAVASCSLVAYNLASGSLRQNEEPVNVPMNAQQIIQQCHSLYTLPGPPKNFNSRSESDRFQRGTKPILIENATLWTGGKNGHEVVSGSLLLDKGLIKAVGRIDQTILDSYEDLDVVDAHGAWVTPGYVHKSCSYLKLTLPPASLTFTHTLEWIVFQNLKGLMTQTRSRALFYLG